MIQRSDVRDEFDDEFIKVARAVVTYCRETVNNTSIQSLVVGSEDNDMTAITCSIVFVLA